MALPGAAPPTCDFFSSCLWHDPKKWAKDNRGAIEAGTQILAAAACMTGVGCVVASDEEDPGELPYGDRADATFRPPGAEHGSCALGRVLGGPVSTDGERIDAWLAGIWAQARSAESPGGAAAVPLDQLRAATAAGRYVGGVVRARARAELVLRDAGGAPLARLSVVGGGHIGWERERFGNDFELERPHLLALLLAGHGVAGSLSALIGPLFTALGLEETDEQFRPVVEGGAVAVAMRRRRVPEPLWPLLAGVPGEEAGALDEPAVAAMAAALGADTPDPVRRARRLLDWLGSLTWPADAGGGEGPLVVRLLATVGRDDVLRALDGPIEPATALGAVAWAAFTKDERGIAERIGGVVTRVLGV
ncbi:hypothetical protein [Dactylosporangium matsuzakiense]|uniref:hypothetical protein n=1 Tax=Dactylosporangium matsuzakiense TaxID=53360 RepID=UPI0021C3DFE6|nr:hypothetical protein [Dactylosporangium matsuzakiense]UWZ47177.1 hypothetical protein Dmats_12650 [Dactylosporangium matsuzakiense]